LHFINPAKEDGFAVNGYGLDHSSAKIILKKYNKRISPTLSLIIPVYQEEKILEKHLKLFTDELRDKYNFEIIVSDGGSNDGTIEIAKNYADVIIKHNKSERQTIAAGRNRGAEQASAGVLIFLNADSIPVDINNFFEVINEFSQRKGIYKKYDALACLVSGFPEEVILKDKIFYAIHNKYVEILNFLGIGMGRGECQVVRKNIFEEAGKYNDAIVAGEDFDLYNRISKISKIKFEKKLHVCESPRRFRKYGYIKTIFYWLINSLTVMFLGKSMSKEWEAVR
jgi:glycosyltransferase involved in cell wall biosynthesis